MENWLGMSGLEIVAAVISIMGIWLGTRQSLWSWPLAIVASGLYAVVFFDVRLYADMVLQVFFMTLSGYGWYAWRFGGKAQTPLLPSWMPSRFWPWLVGIAVVTTGLAGYLLRRFTDADLPYFDAGTTAVSLIAQWMLARKYLENWLVWLGVDVVYVGVYYYKGLYPTLVLYALLIGLAWFGYRSWRKALVHRTVNA
ncbi:nicotinamide mononucleotide transporter [Catalinimonas alkaloidigena]|uniref:Nicotinamide riboside transporter PnuC n=1 Tax=Catalinimonas alkaloidigena TaxID=1075417 RepID=A0A1G9DDK4_9BACT|nr:nicotinamide riboside transporter PnuC [Catalinimonas alkaloidigena]SDK61978.1 nicotinamide mononucleotide transporter [Catalinimonas alkaloidigena]